MIEVDTQTHRFTPTRAAAQQRLVEFQPRAGRHYAEWRNHDFGPDRRDNVSGLSPYVRHRLITEAEVVTAVLARHSFNAAEKFVQEVFWRTYWKGWLEQRPGIWARYKRQLAQQRDRAVSGGLARAYESVITGQTGIDAFDAFAKELVDTGYLHNHARMWFASIWIFTLRLPWELGAAFFQRHLIDWDPASNTLSWRWVAGLQTRGKTYTATASNIERYTDGRFAPQRLASVAQPLDEEPLPPVTPLTLRTQAWPRRPFVLLLTEDDLGIDSMDLPWADVRAVIIIDLSSARLDDGVAAPVRAFVAGALADTTARVRQLAPAAEVICADDTLSAAKIRATAEGHSVDVVAMAEPPVGHVQDTLGGLLPAVETAGLGLHLWRRGWDARAWPHATRGFFAFKEKIPALVAAQT
jgi:hypothetical protein